ncbi:DUF883 domain-containing protein [Sulfitobacter sp. D35]|uniref:DUF883 family protein n=1 Tax=Sulfitobacter sp. D35 TaxID=3083252 RepID=UPI00296E45E8|nr:DUF883 domain-containing protein [Sulfitobacter sp. D35]MDW4499902.1 DUF883 domain-containing protein [Sulfitobacter sp. D35]
MAQSNVVSASKKEPTTADLEAQIATLRDDLGTLTETLKGLGKAKKDELTELAALKAEVAKQKGSEAADAVVQQARDAEAQAREFVRTQPGTALGIAAGLGFLVGLMSARR